MHVRGAHPFELVAVIPWLASDRAQDDDETGATDTVGRGEFITPTNQTSR